MNKLYDIRKKQLWKIIEIVRKIEGRVNILESRFKKKKNKNIIKIKTRKMKWINYR